MSRTMQTVSIHEIAEVGRADGPHVAVVESVVLAGRVQSSSHQEAMRVAIQAEWLEWVVVCCSYLMLKQTG
jgi:hypothetical protein